MKQKVFQLALIGICIFSSFRALAQPNKEECPKFFLKDFLSTKNGTQELACRWSYENYLIRVRCPQTPICQLCSVQGGVPFPFKQIIPSGITSIDISCNIPVGKIIEFGGLCCPSLSFNNTPAECSSGFYEVSDKPVTLIQITSPCDNVGEMYFRVCEASVEHRSISVNTSEEKPLSVFKFNTQANQDKEFKVATDGTKSSKFIINVPALKLRLKENPNGQPSEKFGFLEPSSQKGEYLYTHPEYPQPNTSITLEVVKENGEIFKTIPIKLYQPPVLLVHGLWGSGSSFNKLFFTLVNSPEYESFQVSKCSYESTNDASFSINSSVVENCISGSNGIINKMLSKKIATGKVDIVAHSMGGILSRIYLQNRKEKNQVHKLITLNTPHAGSQLANLIMDQRFEPGNRDACSALKDYKGDDCYKGAIQDLMVNSRAIEGLNSSFEPSTPSHAITSFVSYKDNSLYNLGWELGTMAWYMNLSIPIILGVFNGQPNDGIVAVDSQTGGLSSAISTFVDINHTNTPSAPVVISKIQELLRENPNASSFSKSGFKPVSQTYNDLTPNDAATQKSITTVVIENPIDGKNFLIGDKLEIKITGSSDISFYNVVVDNQAGNSSQEIKKLDGSSGVLTFQLNAEPWLGKREILVLAFDKTQKVIGRATKSIFVNTTEKPKELIVEPGIVSLKVGEKQKFSLTGLYNDFASELNDLPGITYSFSNKKAQYIGNNGIEAKEAGYVEMTISFGSVKSEPIPVTIEKADIATSVDEPSILYNQAPSIKVYPTIAYDNITLEYSSNEGSSGQIEIIDILGRKMVTKKGSFRQGINKETIDVSSLKNGTYFISLAEEGIRVSTKFFKH